MAVVNICQIHGLNCRDFVQLMASSFNTGASVPANMSIRDLSRFLLAGLEWQVPPHTPDMERRRHEAELAWSQWWAAEAEDFQRRASTPESSK